VSNEQGGSITSHRYLPGTRRGLRPGLWAPFTLFVALLLVACGGGDDEIASASVAVPATATTTDPTAAPTETAAGAATEGGRVAQDGDSVQVHYHGTLEDGEVFDSSREREPLGFVVGSGQVISGFDDAVRGLAVGESVTVRLEPGDAYGEPQEELVFDVPADDAPDGLAAGDRVQLQNGAVALVEAISADTVRLNANHPLAGQALTFEIELVAID
jgi:FKBP-type peptidyl-prolyl cis-trans isomerase 2